MATITVNTMGLEAAIARVGRLRRNLIPQTTAAVELYAEQVAGQLRAAAPKGHESGDAMPVGDDAPGALADSFSVYAETNDAGGTITIICSQPNKLRMVRRGTGIYGPMARRITPRTKKALAWPGANHPVKSVSGMHPNDFVTPIVAEARAAVRPIVRETLAAVLAGV